jgi:hypothetical protein
VIKYFDMYKKYRDYGVTYPHLFSFTYLIWKRLFCKRGFHLFDEVLSSDLGHYLNCDACDLTIPIATKHEQLSNDKPGECKEVRRWLSQEERLRQGWL